MSVFAHGRMGELGDQYYGLSDDACGVTLFLTRSFSFLGGSLLGWGAFALALRHRTRALPFRELLKLLLNSRYCLA